MPHISFTSQFQGYQFMLNRRLLDFTPLEMRREAYRYNALKGTADVDLHNKNTPVLTTTDNDSNRLMTFNNAEVASSLDQEDHHIIRGRTRLVSSPLTIIEPNLFVDEVVSTLPYTETTFELGDQFEEPPFQGILGCRGLVGVVVSINSQFY
jgi:hypothetical protein